MGFADSKTGNTLCVSASGSPALPVRQFLSSWRLCLPPPALPGRAVPVLLAPLPVPVLLAPRRGSPRQGSRRTCLQPFFFIFLFFLFPPPGRLRRSRPGGEDDEKTKVRSTFAALMFFHHLPPLGRLRPAPFDPIKHVRMRGIDGIHRIPPYSRGGYIYAC